MNPQAIVSTRGKLRKTPGSPSGLPVLAYHGGPLLANVEVTTIFWGSAWDMDPLRTELHSFFSFAVASSLIDQLAEYSVPGFTIGHGQHVQSYIIPADPAATVDDSAIQQMLDALISGGTIGTPNANSVYFVFLPSGVTVTLQGQASCQNFCGYHDVSPSGVVYAVDTYDDCAGCQFVTGDLLASSTVVASHELCEAITDPQLNAWFDDSTGEEIGDVCEGSTKVITAAGVVSQGAATPGPMFNATVAPASLLIDGSSPVQVTVTLTPAPVAPPPPPPPPPPGESWTVQSEWSNTQGACV